MKLNQKFFSLNDYQHIVAMEIQLKKTCNALLGVITMEDDKLHTKYIRLEEDIPCPVLMFYL